MMKTQRYFRIILALAVFLGGCSFAQVKKDAVFQVSAIKPLLSGSYEGRFSFGFLKRHGDFGIGTFDGLDGEMIAFDNKFYRIRTDGMVYPVDDSVKTCFAAVKFYRPDKKIFLADEIDFGQLQKYLDSLLPSPNIIYAVRIEGSFSFVKTRSVSGQEKPYLPLAEIVKKQVLFEFRGVRGTLIGFRFPAYFEGLNVPGYHFHFITSDKKSGGHVLDCRLNNVDIGIDDSFDFCVKLPDNSEFFEMDLTKDRRAELQKVEK